MIWTKGKYYYLAYNNLLQLLKHIVCHTLKNNHKNPPNSVNKGEGTINLDWVLWHWLLCFILYAVYYYSVLNCSFAAAAPIGLLTPANVNNIRRIKRKRIYYIGLIQTIVRWGWLRLALLVNTIIYFYISEI